MVEELFGIVAAQKGQADILPGILVPFPTGINQKSGVAVGFVVGIGGEGRTEAFDFKEVVGAKQPGNVFANWSIRKLMDDEQVNTVIIFAKDVF